MYYLDILSNFKIFQFPKHLFTSVSSVAQSCLILSDPKPAKYQASLPITNSRSLLRFMSHQVGDAIQPSHLLSSPSLPASNLSQHQSLSNEYLGLFSFRMDWLDLLAIQGTLKSILQHHSSKTSILWHSACFIVQLSYPYMTTGKTIALTRRTFVGKVMSLLFNMLSRLVIDFLPRSKCLLISWLHLPQ